MSVGPLGACGGKSIADPAPPPRVSQSDATVVAEDEPVAATPPPVVVEPEEADAEPGHESQKGRQVGDLFIPATPSELQQHAAMRLRSHTTGALSKGDARVWIGPPIPSFVPVMDGSRELSILDRDGSGFLAVYRDPFGAGSCTLAGSVPCSVSVHLYGEDGVRNWQIELDAHLRSTRTIEIQDVHFDRGTLFFNEACSSYAATSKGQCSSLVGFDPVQRKVLWRSNNLTSNGVFLVEEDFVLTGYGFTSEPDYVYALDRRTGATLARVRLSSAHQGLRRHSQDLYQVEEHGGRVRFLEVRRRDGRLSLHLRTSAPGL